MTINQQVTLDLDKTGTNPDNFISGEPHSLSNRPTRSIAPKRGAFFASSVVLRADGREWRARGTDFQIVELHQEATLLFGLEVSSVILVINPDIPSEVEIDYQAVGGKYSNNDSTIASLYQALISDDRPIDFNNIFNKPSEFNPKVHRHLLDDIFGFEPVVDYLERIKRAITLGQTDVVLAIVERLLSNFKQKELPRIVPTPKMMGYDAFLYFMTRRKLADNQIWIDTPDEVWRKGTDGRLRIDTSELPVGMTLYYQFYSSDGPVVLFNRKPVPFITNGGIVEIRVYIPAETYVANEHLYVGVKRDPDAEEFEAVTYRINVVEPYSTDSLYGYMIYANVDQHDFDNQVGGIATDPVRRLLYLTHLK